MTNPYHEPTAAVSNAPIKISVASRILSGLGLSGSILTAVIVTFIVPSFASVFESFGADLPLATYFVLNFYLAIWFFPLVVVVAFYRWPTPSRRPMSAFLIGVVGAFILFPAIMAALYFPIFALAASP